MLQGTRSHPRGGFVDEALSPRISQHLLCNRAPSRGWAWPSYGHPDSSARRAAQRTPFYPGLEVLPRSLKRSHQQYFEPLVGPQLPLLGAEGGQLSGGQVPLWVGLSGGIVAQLFTWLPSWKTLVLGSQDGASEMWVAIPPLSTTSHVTWACLRPALGLSFPMPKGELVRGPLRARPQAFTDPTPGRGVKLRVLKPHFEERLQLRPG